MKTYGYVYISEQQISKLEKYGTTLNHARIETFFLNLSSAADKHSIYVEKSTDRSEEEHIRFLEKFIKSITNSSLVIVNLKDFSYDETVVASLYTLCWNGNVGLQVLDTPWLNVNFLKNTKLSLDMALSIIKKIYYCERHKSSEIQSAKAYLQQKQKIAIAQTRPSTLTTKKSIDSKAIIIEKSCSFNGKMRDADLIEELGISRNSFYKYKRELKAELIINEKAE